MHARTFIRIGLFMTVLALFTFVMPGRESVEASTFNATLSGSGVVSSGVVSSSSGVVVSTSTQKSLNNIPVQTSVPVKVVIPAINLNSKVLALGKDKTGNMAVPNGNTKNVGWYKDGTIPGNIGSAVLDAHVFAAFSNLKNLKIGDDIYIINSQNVKLHFVVSDKKTYALNTLTSEMLFGQNDDRRLNLITCAGKLTSDKSTYDHRIVVFALLKDILKS